MRNKKSIISKIFTSAAVALALAISFVCGFSFLGKEETPTQEPRKTYTLSLNSGFSQNQYIVAGGKVYGSMKASAEQVGLAELASAVGGPSFDDQNTLEIVFMKDGVTSVAADETANEIASMLQATKTDDGVEVVVTSQYDQTTIQTSLDAAYTLGSLVVESNNTLEYKNEQFEINSKNQTSFMDTTEQDTTARVLRLDKGTFNLLGAKTYEAYDKTDRAIYQSGGVLTIDGAEITNESGETTKSDGPTFTGFGTGTTSGSILKITGGTFNFNAGTMGTQTNQTANSAIYSNSGSSIIDASGTLVVDPEDSSNITFGTILNLNGGAISGNSATNGIKLGVGALANLFGTDIKYNHFSHSAIWANNQAGTIDGKIVIKGILIDGSNISNNTCAYVVDAFDENAVTSTAMQFKSGAISGNTDLVNLINFGGVYFIVYPSDTSSEEEPDYSIITSFISNNICSGELLRIYQTYEDDYPQCMIFSCEISGNTCDRVMTYRSNTAEIGLEDSIITNNNVKNEIAYIEVDTLEDGSENVGALIVMNLTITNNTTGNTLFGSNSTGKGSALKGKYGAALGIFGDLTCTGNTAEYVSSNYTILYYGGAITENSKFKLAEYQTCELGASLDNKIYIEKDAVASQNLDATEAIRSIIVYGSKSDMQASIDYIDESASYGVGQERWLFYDDSYGYIFCTYKTYGITFDANGGTISGSSSSTESQEVYYSQDITGFNVSAERAGYVFSGFWTSQEGGTKIVDESGNLMAVDGYTQEITLEDGSKKMQFVYDTTSDSRSLTFYAQWNISNYTVKFNGNQPSAASTTISGSMAAQTLVYNGANQQLNANQFVLNGYTFQGWSNKPFDGVGIIYYSGSNVYFFYVNNGEDFDLTMSPIKKSGDDTIYGYYNEDEKVYIFEDESLVYNLTTDEITLYAIWLCDVITITLDSSLYSSTAGLSATTEGTKNIYYFFDSSFYSSVYVDGELGFDTRYEIEKINLPTLTGYTFGGYFTGKTGTGTQYILADGTICSEEKTENGVKQSTLYNHVYEDTTLYALWTANTYTVEFVGNWIDDQNVASNLVSGSMATQTFTYDEAQALRANMFELTGWTFMGWSGATAGKYGSQSTTTNDISTTTEIPSGYNVYNNATGTIIPNGYYVKNLASTNGATVTLYAVWQANTITISLNSNLYKSSSDTTGTAATSAGTLAIYYKFDTNTYYTTKNADGTLSDVISKITAPTRNGYTFGGYFTGKTGTGTQYVLADGTICTTASGSQSSLYNNVYENKTLYASWTANTITISLNSNMYKSSSDTTGTAATSAGTLAIYYKFDTNTYYTTKNANGTLSDAILNITAPTRNGYTFGGYFNTKYYAGQLENGTMFVAPSGTICAAEKSESGVTQSTLYNHVYKDATLYAKWTANKITVTLDKNGGTGGHDYVEYTFDSNTYYYYKNGSIISDTTIELPTRTGYTFGGYWECTLSGGAITSYDKQYIYEEKNDIINNLYNNIYNNSTLYAKWTANTYTISFDGNAGEDTSLVQTILRNNVNIGSDEMSVTFDATISFVASATRTGYEFLGYFTSATGGTKIFDEKGNVCEAAGYTTKVDTVINWTNAGDITLYAQWQLLAYTITIEINDTNKTGTEYWGTLAASGNAQNVEYNSASGTLTIKNVTHFSTISASENVITISGSDSGSTTTTITATPSAKTGYTIAFSGWTSGESTYTGTTSLTGNLNVTANFTKIPHTYTISFAAGEGGSGSMTSGNGVTVSSNQFTATFDAQYKLPKNTFTKTGYSFAGWVVSSTNFDDKTAKYGETSANTALTTATAIADEYYVKNLASASGVTVTLTAQWQINEYTLTLNYGTGISAVGKYLATEASPYISGGSFTVEYGQEIAIYATVLAGYIFDGWTIDSAPSGFALSGATVGREGTAAYYETGYYIATMPAGDVTLTATGTIMKYTVTVKVNDANKTDDEYWGTLSGGTQTGSTNIEIKNVDYGTSISTNGNTLSIGSTTITATPSTKTGYTIAFSGWTDSGEGEVASERTITANFTRNANFYEIVVHVNGGAEDSLTFEFEYFTGNGGNTSSFTITGDETATVYALYGDLYFYYAPSGKPTHENDGVDVYRISNVSGTKIGWKFNGIWSAATGGTQIMTAGGSNIVAGTTYFNTYKKWHYAYDGNIDTYAQWEINEYTLTINATAGVSVGVASKTADTTGSTTIDGITYTQTTYQITYNEALNISANITTGYTFIGWSGYKAGTDTSLSFSMPADNVELTATAKINTYTITVNVNAANRDDSYGYWGTIGDNLTNGLVTITIQNVEYGSTIVSNDNVLKIMGSNLTNNSDIVVKEITATAKDLSEKGYTIKFDSWTGGAISSVQENLTVVANFVRTGNVSYFSTSWKNKLTQRSGSYSATNLATISFTQVEPETIGYDCISVGAKDATGTADYATGTDGVTDIKAYIKSNTDTTGKYDVIFYSPVTIYAPESCSGLFGGLTSCTSITFDNFNTSNVTSMNSMFMRCLSLTSIDLSNFNTSNVTDMSGMFLMGEDSSALETIQFGSNFDTSKVTNMSALFSAASYKFKTLDVSMFNTSNVTDMSGMFGCGLSLTSLDLSNFDTSNVTDMMGMFMGASSLTNLNLSNFDTSNVTDFGAMFYGCTSLNTLDISNFIVSSSAVTEFALMEDYILGMFDGCTALALLNAPKQIDQTISLPHTMYYEENGGYVGVTSLSAEVEKKTLRTFIQGGAHLATNWVTTLTLAAGASESYVDELKAMVSSITFTTTAPTSYDMAVSVGSASMDGSMAYVAGIDGLHDVVAYVIMSSDQTTADLIFYSDTIIYAPISCASLFANLTSCSSMEFDNFSTKVTTKFTKMFSGCTSLNTLDISTFTIPESEGGTFTRTQYMNNLLYVDPDPDSSTKISRDEYINSLVDTDEQVKALIANMGFEETNNGQPWTIDSMSEAVAEIMVDQADEDSSMYATYQTNPEKVVAVMKTYTILAALIQECDHTEIPLTLDEYCILMSAMEMDDWTITSAVDLYNKYGEEGGFSSYEEAKADIITQAADAGLNIVESEEDLYFYSSSVSTSVSTSNELLNALGAPDFNVNNGFAWTLDTLAQYLSEQLLTSNEEFAEAYSSNATNAVDSIKYYIIAKAVQLGHSEIPMSGGEWYLGYYSIVQGDPYNMRSYSAEQLDQLFANDSQEEINATCAPYGFTNIVKNQSDAQVVYSNITQDMLANCNLTILYAPKSIGTSIMLLHTMYYEETEGDGNWIETGALTSKHAGKVLKTFIQEGAAYLYIAWKAVLENANSSYSDYNINSILFTNQKPSGSDYTTVQVGAINKTGDVLYASSNIDDPHRVTAFVKESSTSGKYDVIIYSSLTIYAPKRSEKLFASLTSCKSIIFNNFSTSNVTDLQENIEFFSTFYGCLSLTELDLSSWDTSNVTEMGGMFANCPSLVKLNISSFVIGSSTMVRPLLDTCPALEILYAPKEINQEVSLPYAMYYDNNGTLTSTQYLTSDCQGKVLYAESQLSTITLDANGGTCGTASIKAPQGSTYGTLPTPTAYTKTGYTVTFAGWWTEATGGTQITASTKVTTSSDHTLYAHWTETVNTYTITYDANGGTISSSSHTTAYNIENGITLATVSTRNGYTFTGWKVTQVNGSTTSNYTYGGWTVDNTFASGESISVGKYANVTLTAQWEIHRAYLLQNWGTALTTEDSNYSKSNINSILFTSDASALPTTYLHAISVGVLDAAGSTAWSQQYEYLYDITAYIKESSVSGKYDVIFYSPVTIYAPTSCNSLFSYLTSCTSITFDNFNTSKVTDMSYMFDSCESLTTLNLSSFTIGSSTDVSNMFTGCTALAILNAPKEINQEVSLPITMYYEESSGNWIGVTSLTSAVAGKTLRAEYTIEITTSETETQTLTLKAGQTYTLYNPTAPTGYSFAGWSTTSDDLTSVDILPAASASAASLMRTRLLTTSGTTMTCLSSKTYYAVWKKVWTFCTGSGTQTEETTYYAYNNTSSASQTYTLNNPTAPTGYSFAGWATEISTAIATAAGTSQTTLTSASNTPVFYAVWKYTVSVTYNGNNSTGGSTRATNGTAYKTYNLGKTTNASITLAANGFTRTGYTFSNWAQGSTSGTQCAAGATASLSANTTFYAIWTANTYTIKYTLNGGTAGTKAPTSATFDVAFEISNPTRTGYTFAGWTASGNFDTSTAKYGTSSSAVATAWSNASTKVTATYFKNLCSTSGGEVTLTAQWNVNSYDLKVYAYFDSATSTTFSNGTTGGTVKIGSGTAGASATIKINYGSTASITASAATGYTFKGWWTNSSFSGNAASTSATMTTAAMTTSGLTYYAKFAVDSYTLTLNKGTGISAVSGAGTYKYGQEVSITATVSSGYTWNTWTLSGTTPITYAAKTQNQTIKMGAGHTTLTASATLNTYKVTASYGTGISAIAYNTSSSGTYTTINNGSSVTLNANTTYYFKATASTGYTFSKWSNWFTSTSNPASKSETATTARTLTASATLNTYKVTASYGTGISEIAYNTSSGGTYTTINNNSSVTLNANTTYYFKATASTGYTFSTWSNWFTSTSNPASKSETATTARTLTASATGNEYTLTLDAKLYSSSSATSGTAATSTGTTEIKYKFGTNNYYTSSNSSLNSGINIPTLTGYTFGGYFTGKTGTGTQYVDASGKILNNPYNTKSSSTTLYAKWTVNSYTITFDGNGSEVQYALTWNYAGGGDYADGNSNYSSYSFDATKAKRTLNYGTTLGINSPVPVRRGYSFNGWWTAASGGTQVIASGAKAFNASVSGYTNASKQWINAANITLYAQWTAKTYTITYDYDNGTKGANNPTSYTVASAASVSDPTRSGYTFAGWTVVATVSQMNKAYIDLNSGYQHYSSDNSNAVIYEPFYIKNGVEYSAPLGNGEIRWRSYNISTGAYAGSISSSSSYTPTADSNIAIWYHLGYSSNTTTITFSGGKSFSTSAYKTTGNLKLTANWTANKYTVSFDPNGGTCSTTSKDVTYGSTYGTLPTPSRTGYDFTGWSNNMFDMSEWIKVYEASGSITGGTYVAHDSSSITLSAEGGDCYTNPYAGASAYKVAVVPGKTYIFSWKQDTNIQPRVMLFPLTSATANYKRVDIDGGTYDAATGRYYLTFTMESNEIYLSFRFGMRYQTGQIKFSDIRLDEVITSSDTSARITSTTTVTTPHNHTLMAQWKTIGYTITYNANGGTASAANQTYNIASSITLATVSTRNGYTFTGWKVTTAAGNWTSGKTYSSGDSISKGMYGHVTLTAQWTANTYKVRYFDTFNNTSSYREVTYTYNDSSKTFPGGSLGSPWTFVSWTTSSTSTAATSYTAGKAVSNLSTTNGAVINMYSVYYRTMTLAFNANGGSGSVTSQTGKQYYNRPSVKYTSPSVTIPTTQISRTGYTFGGWNTAEDGTGTTYASGATYTFTGNQDSEATITLYAKWNTITYTITYENITNTNNTTVKNSSGSVLTPYTIKNDEGKVVKYYFTQTYTIETNLTLYSVSREHTNTPVWKPSSSVGKWTSASYNSGANVGKGMYGDVTLNFGYTWDTWQVVFDFQIGTSESRERVISDDNILYQYNLGETAFIVPYNGTIADIVSDINDGNPFVDGLPDITGLYGWYKNAEGKGSAIEAKTQLNSDAGFMVDETNKIFTIYAVWNSFNVVYHGKTEDGDGFNSSELTAYGLNITLPSPILEEDTGSNTATTGWTFNGWYTGENGTGTKVGGIGSTYTVTATSTLHLYAYWTLTYYTITYNTNYGSISSSSYTTTYTIKTYIRFPLATRTGYNFNCWEMTTTAGNWTESYIWETDIDLGEYIGRYGNITLTAQWTANTYSISYTLNGGAFTSTTKTTTASYNDWFHVPIPERTGYTFSSWEISGMDSCTHYYGNRDADYYVTTATTLSSNYTDFMNLRSTSGTVYFNAKWKAKTYTITYVYNDDNMSGKYITHSTAPTTATYDTSFTVSKPTRGAMLGGSYPFQGWTISGMDSCTHYYGSNPTTATILSAITATSFKNLRSTAGTVTFTASWGSWSTSGTSLDDSVSIATPMVDKLGGGIASTCSLALVGQETDTSSGMLMDDQETTSCSWLDDKKTYSAFGSWLDDKFRKLQEKQSTTVDFTGVTFT